MAEPREVHIPVNIAGYELTRSHWPEHGFTEPEGWYNGGNLYLYKDGIFLWDWACGVFMCRAGGFAFTQRRALRAYFKHNVNAVHGDVDDERDF